MGDFVPVRFGFHLVKEAGGVGWVRNSDHWKCLCGIWRKYSRVLNFPLSYGTVRWSQSVVSVIQRQVCVGLRLLAHRSGIGIRLQFLDLIVWSLLKLWNQVLGTHRWLQWHLIALCGLFDFRWLDPTTILTCPEIGGSRLTRLIAQERLVIDLLLKLNGTFELLIALVHRWACWTLQLRLKFVTLVVFCGLIELIFFWFQSLWLCFFNMWISRRNWPLLVGVLRSQVLEVLDISTNNFLFGHFLFTLNSLIIEYIWRPHLPCSSVGRPWISWAMV